ncbi:MULTISPECIES: UTP--glucose-1-phosphate uridylyltransferase GalU [Bacillus]|uniref:UTP--glucose-1-phosphate uridylyltransferase GalU n=1 Tax=Bacillus TaxID=1386 RepID=UPI000BA53E38|nr:MULTISPECIES: UTP--glucose-1-phosphate uridylyltransferase GalU [Bacillus]OYN65953.1 UTP--glucose-1-phosphate uridylyltransferase [Bacillus safensis]QRF34068.1 UTP--glucose-1-phosphate uridylyltransferase GalU [Bacillus safensis]QRY38280.1 UTP--glucose-1-phosphate uridylyltransferase GalU [Bacillus sp. PDNC022]WAT82642.1 UTP--glucose-1-phosphate uridylyltransferase GalU [Bacillus safensis]
MNIKKAVIPAAGLGTRFLPATKAQPKEMLPIIDKPAIQYIVEEAVQSGIEDILIITGRNKKSIEDHFDRSFELEHTLLEKGKNEQLAEIKHIADMANIHYIRQKEPLGLGHAVLCARHFTGNDPFAVLLGDDVMVSERPALSQLMEVFEDKQREVIGVQQVDRLDVSKYGMIRPARVDGQVFEVTDLVEKPAIHEAPSDLAVMGRYLLTPSIFPILQGIERGAGNEIQLTDALKIIAHESPIYAKQLDGMRFDVGDKLGSFKAAAEIGLMRHDMRPAMLAYMQSILMREAKQA